MSVAIFNNFLFQDDMHTSLEKNEDTSRATLRRIRQILDGTPGLTARFKKARKIIRNFRRPAFYEISQECGLFCEGCYYFEDSSREHINQEMTPEQWQDFFAGEKKRGVTMAYLVGAEPSMHMDRLLAASENIRFGKIGTNGMIRIHPDVQFRIGVSVWGDDDYDLKFRHGGMLRKAFENYEGDPRAVMLYTLSPWNLHTVKDIVRMSAEHGLEITFSMYSPTSTYLKKLADSVPADNKYFHLGDSIKSPVFSADDLHKIKDLTTEMLETYPETLLLTQGYNKRMTRSGSLYAIDQETGIAEDCASRIKEPLHYYRVDGVKQNQKCCTPSIDCKHCRLYSGGWSSLFEPGPEYLVDSQSFIEWLDMIDMLGRIFLYPYPFAEES
jgi:hypothetical protein